MVSRVLRLSSSSPAFLLSPPFVPFTSLLVAVSSSRLVKRKHCRVVRRVHFSCAVFLFFNVFFFPFCGGSEGKGKGGGN